MLCVSVKVSGDHENIHITITVASSIICEQNDDPYIAQKVSIIFKMRIFCKRRKIGTFVK